MEEEEDEGTKKLRLNNNRAINVEDEVGEEGVKKIKTAGVKEVEGEEDKEGKDKELVEGSKDKEEVKKSPTLKKSPTQPLKEPTKQPERRKSRRTLAKPYGKEKGSSDEEVGFLSSKYLFTY